MSWDTTTTGESSAPKPSPDSLSLDAGEVRVLGALIEKEVSTPAYYPLSLVALVNACNQKTNRRPVTAHSAEDVGAVLDGLREKRLVTFVSGGTHQVTKYKQNLTRLYAFDPEETAAVCVLMLRGPLTPGEIRQTAAGLHPFASLEAVDATLDRLAEFLHGPVVARLPRQPGQKEIRFAHLLAGPPPATLPPVDGADEPPDATVSLPSQAGQTGTIRRLEAEVAALRAELDDLKTRFEELRAQLGG
ncbi:MAG: DUF480 domain-containing protein [Acidobacteria bacterium]|nr:DUF480 domain-containing protein [Acidobacteriota bacterium]